MNTLTTRGKKRGGALVVVALFVFPGLLNSSPPSFLPAQGSRLPRPSDVVKPRTYVSLESVPRGADFEVAVVGEILPGFHVNASKVHEDYLIPTTLEAAPPPGIRVVQTSFPPGLDKKFPFSGKALAVYESKFVVRMKAQAARDVPLGAMQIPMTLRYQACNDSACLPPVKIPVVAELTIAAAGTKAKPANAEFFPRK